jgi:hypothetical protein
MDHIFGEAIEIELHPNILNRDVGFCLSKSWKPLICSLKKPSEHDTRSAKLHRSYPIGSSCPEAAGSMLAQ